MSHAVVQEMLDSVSWRSRNVVRHWSASCCSPGATTVFAELQDALDRIWLCRSGPEAAARAAAVLRHDLGIGLAHRVAGRQRGAGGMEPLVDPDSKQLTTFTGLSVRIRPELRLRDGGVRVMHLQDHAARQHRPARCPGGRAVTSVPPSARRQIGLYIGGIAASRRCSVAASLIVVPLWCTYWQIFLFGAEFTWSIHTATARAASRTLPQHTPRGWPEHDPNSTCAVRRSRSDQRHLARGQVVHRSRRS